MHPDTGDEVWWFLPLLITVVIAFALNALRIIVRDYRRGTLDDPLPRLTAESSPAAVRQHHTAAPDAWLIEVEYSDAAGSAQRACLADLVPDEALDRFEIGTVVDVYIFEPAHMRFQRPSPTGGAPVGRCLLTEAADDVPRAGYNLDGLRMISETVIWERARFGSPVLGIKAVKTDDDRWSGAVRGERRSFDAEPRRVWAESEHAPRLELPGRPPHPKSAAEVVKWDDPDGFSRVELGEAPVLWTLLPLAAVGFLTYESVTDPTGSHWNKRFFDESVDAWPTWFLWAVWIVALGWLLIAVGVLVFRARRLPELSDDAKHVFTHGVLCSLHRSPVTNSDGEGGSYPTFIAIDHRLDRARAGRIHRAFYTWLEDLGRPPGGEALSSEQIFGSGVTGGLYLDSIPGFGTSEFFAQHQWVIVTEAETADAGAAAFRVTPVPLDDERAKMRKKLQRRGVI